MNILRVVLHFSHILLALPNATGFQFFPHDGDNMIVDTNVGVSHLTVGNSDDGIKVIDTPNFPFHNDGINLKVQVSTNGYIVLDGENISNAPSPSNFSVAQELFSLPFIAPFWTDLKYKQNSSLSYQVHSSKDVLDKIRAQVAVQFPNDPFYPSYALVVTWFGVCHEALSENCGSIQAALASDGLTTYTLFLYKKLPLNVTVVVGHQYDLKMFAYPASTNSSEANNVEDNSIQVNRVAYQEFTCQNKSDGSYPVPTKCDTFITCYNGYASATRCNVSEHYHPVNKYCVPASFYLCNGGIPAVSIPPNEPIEIPFIIFGGPDANLLNKNVNTRVIKNSCLKQAKAYLKALRNRRQGFAGRRNRIKFHFKELIKKYNNLHRIICNDIRLLQERIDILDGRIKLIRYHLSKEECYTEESVRLLKKELKKRQESRKNVQKLLLQLQTKKMKIPAKIENLKKCLPLCEPL